MKDPYQVLGIGRNASDEEVKKAYRQMARKYHPDKNPGNQAAEEMFKIVQEAYSSIIDERKNGGTGSSVHGSYRYGGSGASTSGSYTYRGGSQGQTQNFRSSETDIRYQAAINYLNNGYYREAMNVLMNIKERDAAWYYLSAVANNGLGNNYAALQQARTAVSMEPENWTYRQYLSLLENQSVRYRGRNQSMAGNGMSDCGFCTQLCACELCLELCCDVSICC